MLKKLTDAYALAMMSMGCLFFFCVSFTHDVTPVEGSPETTKVEKSKFGVDVALSETRIASGTTLNVQVSSTMNVRCFGGSDGSATVVVSNGSSPFSYNWSNGGSTTATNNTLSAGFFAVTVTDGTGCTGIASGTISQPSQLQVTITGQTNIGCASSTGSATAGASGGTPGYSYLWSNGSTNNTINVTSAGTYTATVTDFNGCTGTTQANITSESPPIADAGPDMMLDCNNLSVVLSGLNSTSGASITYQWSTSGGNIVSGSTTRTPTVNAAGTYTILVTDNNTGCTASDDAVVTQVAGPSFSALQTNVACNGECTGSIDLTVVGGVPPLTLDWSDNSLDGIEDPTGLCAGAFGITIIDANNCIASSTIVISEPSALSLSISGLTNISCASPTGSATVNASGGTPAYSYLWSNGTTNPTINVMTAGVYTVTVTDANNCTATTSTSITNNATPPTADAGPDMQLNCNNMSVVLSGINSSVGSVTYQWSTSGGNITSGSSTLTPTVNAAGTYTLVVTDNNTGCSASDEAVVTQVADPSISSTQTNVSCHGTCDGSIDLTISGGAAPLTFDWSDNSLDGTEDPTGLCAGTFGITVIDANNCMASSTITITEPSIMQASISGQTNISCASPTGTATVAVTGGTPSHSFLWSTGTTGATVSVMAAGTYTATVTDANNCTATAVATISSNATPPTADAGPDMQLNCNNMSVVLSGTNSSVGSVTYQWTASAGGNIVSGATTTTPTVNAAGTYTLVVTDTNTGCSASDMAMVTQVADPSISGVVTNVSCNGDSDGRIDLTISGGQPSFTFDWSDNSLDGIEDPSGLSAGTFTVTVTDANNCIASATYVVNEPSPLLLSGTTVNVDCNGSDNGSIDLTVSGGTAPYDYDWSDDNFDGMQDPTGLGAGNYTVTVTDNNNCTETASFTIDEPNAISLSATSTNATCGQCNGTIDLTASGGNGLYTYLWQPGNLTLEDPNGLCPGTYTVTVTDDNGCTATLSEEVIESPNLDGVVVTTDVSCAGSCDGTVSAAITSGSPPYSYLWSDGVITAVNTGVCAGTYTVTVTDNNGCTITSSGVVNEPLELVITSRTITNVSCNGACDGSAEINAGGGTMPYTYSLNGAPQVSTNSFTDLCAGSYLVVVTDANGCTVASGFTITEPDILSPNASATGETSAGANDGTATAAPTGGTPLYTYLWSNSAVTSSITGLSPGAYTVTVTDQNNCIATETIVVNAFDCTNITVGIVGDDIACNGEATGQATAQIMGFSTMVSYNWSNGGTTASISGLIAGTYTVTVTDSDNCSATASVVINQPPPIILTVTSTPVSMAGLSDGTATANVSGGTGFPYTYAWDNNAITQTINNLPAGVYCVTVADGNSCSAEACTTVEGIDCSNFSATVSTTDVTCNGFSDGSAVATPVGGTSPYSYAWSGINSGEASVNGLSADTYTVTITDAQGCTATETFTITEPPALTLSVTTTPTSMAGATDGTATANVGGGTMPYSYLWSQNDNAQTATGLAAGDYCVTVTDANGCTIEGCGRVEDGVNCNNFSISGMTTNVSCNGGNDGVISVTPTGTAPFTYAWSGVSSMEDTVDGLSAGTYTVTVTDAVGCMDAMSFIVMEPTPINIGVRLLNQTLCFGTCDGVIELSPSGGTQPYDIQWGHADIGFVIDSLCAGTYSFTVTDANGCTFDDAVVFEEAPEFTLTISSTDETAPGANDGTATVVASGGVMPYTYLWNTIDETPSISNLSPGEYCVIVVDSIGCTMEACVFVNPFGCSVQVDVSTNNLTCFGECTGMLTVEPSGGVAPYTYAWNDGAIGDTPNPTELCVGIYEVTVTDAEGCIGVVTGIMVEEAPQLDVQIGSITPASCFSVCDGQIEFVVSGGVGPYTFNTTAVDFSQLCPGGYEVEVVDAIGCSTSFEFNIAQPPAITITIDSIGAAQAGMSNGFIEISATGGTGQLSYEWGLDGNLVSTDQDPTGLAAGEYDLIITDENGCMFTETIIVPMSTSTEDITAFGSFQLFPNPTKGNINMIFDLRQQSDIRVTLFDMTGRRLLLRTYDNLRQENVALQLNDLAEGMYALFIEGEGFQHFEKIVVVK
ncbi:MAG: T9SS type A sorting domain-containing protein [Bacteroidota bacterium]